MSAHIPQTLAKDPLHQPITDAGLELVHRGKVRSAFKIPHHPDLLLTLASNGISIFDFVLNTMVPKKGEVLTAMTVFWTDILHGIPNHLVASGRSIDQYLPHQLGDNSELRKRALVIKKLDMLPIECIVRGYLTGNGWASYQKDGTVCGIKLPLGLYDGAKILPEPILTPTTKAEVGHDVPIPLDSMIESYGKLVCERSLFCYTKMSQLAQTRGIVLADTKFEFGKDGTLADEVGTPDSSRFWDFASWTECSVQRFSPPSRDKEYVRKWGKTMGLHKLDPLNPEHLSHVDGLTVPQDVVDTTTHIYLSILQQLTRIKLEQFQTQFLGV